MFAAVRLPLIPVKSDWQPQVAQQLKGLLNQKPHCSVRELTEGFYSVVEEDGVKLRTVELKVGEVNVADALVEQGLAKREQHPRDSLTLVPLIRESNQGGVAPEVCGKVELAALKYELKDSVDAREAVVEEENVDISTSDDEDMTSMVDLRGWSPKAEVKEKRSEEPKEKENRKLMVEVLSVVSPACIWLRDKTSAWPQFNCLLQQQRSQIGKKISEEELLQRQMVLVRISNLICRGELVKQNVEEDKLEVWLVDHGKLVVLDKSDVGLLLVEELSSAAPFSFSVALAEVEAAGTSDPLEWSGESTLTLKEIIKGKEVAMETLQTDGAAVIWVGETICKDPFGVEQSHWRKVGELLQQKGLALPKGTAQFIRQKLNCPLESCEDDEATNSDAEEADSSPKNGEPALESDTESVTLSLPDLVEKKPRHLASCFSGSLVKVDQSGLVWVKEAAQGQEVSLRLAGVKKVAGKIPCRLLQQIETNAECRVVLSGNSQRGLGPFTGDIFYKLSGRGDGEGNLALVGLEQGLLEVVTTWEEWANEVDECEDAIAKGSSSQLPYPLPLALGLWLPVNITMVHPKLPMVFLRARYVRADTCFAQFRREMEKSLHTTMDQVSKMEASFSQAREEFAKQAEQEQGGKEMKKQHSVGDPVLALYENQEWCRGIVVKATDAEATVDLSDFGHPVSVESRQMRRVSMEMWKGPRQGRTVFYHQPPADEWQEV